MKGCVAIWAVEVCTTSGEEGADIATLASDQIVCASDAFCVLMILQFDFCPSDIQVSSTSSAHNKQVNRINHTAFNEDVLILSYYI